MNEHWVRKAIAPVVVLGFFLILYLALSSSASETDQIIGHPQKGVFLVSINATGQLEAKNSTSILAPRELGEAEIWEIKIDQIVNEGTIVKKGDFVALLDRSAVLTKISEQEKEIEKVRNDQIQIRIDTAIELGKLRDGMSNLKYDIKQKRIAVKQSVYEPPATVEQFQMNLEKAEQDYKSALDGYALQRQKAAAEFSKVSIAFSNAKEKLSKLNALLTSSPFWLRKTGWSFTKKREGATS